MTKEQLEKAKVLNKEIERISNTHIYINGNGVLYEGLFSGWEFLDGSPCGKEVTL